MNSKTKIIKPLTIAIMALGIGFSSVSFAVEAVPQAQEGIGWLTPPAGWWGEASKGVYLLGGTITADKLQSANMLAGTRVIAFDKSTKITDSAVPAFTSFIQAYPDKVFILQSSDPVVAKTVISSAQRLALDVDSTQASKLYSGILGTGSYKFQLLAVRGESTYNAPIIATVENNRNLTVDRLGVSLLSTPTAAEARLYGRAAGVAKAYTLAPRVAFSPSVANAVAAGIAQVPPHELASSFTYLPSDKDTIAGGALSMYKNYIAGRGNQPYTVGGTASSLSGIDLNMFDKASHLLVYQANSVSSMKPFMTGVQNNTLRKVTFVGVTDNAAAVSLLQSSKAKFELLTNGNNSVVSVTHEPKKLERRNLPIADAEASMVTSGQAVTAALNKGRVVTSAQLSDTDLNTIFDSKQRNLMAESADGHAITWHRADTARQSSTTDALQPIIEGGEGIN